MRGMPCQQNDVRSCRPGATQDAFGQCLGPGIGPAAGAVSCASQGHFPSILNKVASEILLHLPLTVTFSSPSRRFFSRNGSLGAVALGCRGLHPRVQPGSRSARARARGGSQCWHASSESQPGVVAGSCRLGLPSKAANSGLAGSEDARGRGLHLQRGAAPGKGAASGPRVEGRSPRASPNQSPRRRGPLRSDHSS